MYNDKRYQIYKSYPALSSLYKLSCGTIICLGLIKKGVL